MPENAGYCGKYDLLKIVPQYLKPSNDKRLKADMTVRTKHCGINAVLLFGMNVVFII